MLTAFIYLFIYLFIFILSGEHRLHKKVWPSPKPYFMPHASYSLNDIVGKALLWASSVYWDTNNPFISSGQ